MPRVANPSSWHERKLSDGQTIRLQTLRLPLPGTGSYLVPHERTASHPAGQGARLHHSLRFRILWRLARAARGPARRERRPRSHEPPFALLRKKEYGNDDQDSYVDWLLAFGRLVLRKLKPEGSFVLDLGGAYQRGTPARSLYNFRVLLRLCDEVGFFLAEDFYWFNPSKLPSPIEWVNKRKLRAKDSVNTVWWLSKTEWPKADVSKVLAEYSPRMKKLLQDPEAFYKPALRPSGHDIGSSFERTTEGQYPQISCKFRTRSRTACIWLAARRSA